MKPAGLYGCRNLLKADELREQLRRLGAEVDDRFNSWSWRDLNFDDRGWGPKIPHARLRGQRERANDDLAIRSRAHNNHAGVQSPTTSSLVTPAPVALRPGSPGTVTLGGRADQEGEDGWTEKVATVGSPPRAEWQRRSR